MKKDIAKIGAALVSAALLTVGLSVLAGCSSSEGASSASSSAAFSAAASSDVTSSASSQAVQAGDMTIHVTMQEDVTQSTDVDSPLQFAEETIDIVAPDGATALEVLQGTDREVGMSGSGDSTEVTSIGGLENGAAGEGSHWTYSVNGEVQQASPAVRTLSDGDALVWTFVK